MDPSTLALCLPKLPCSLSFKKPSLHPYHNHHPQPLVPAFRVTCSSPSSNSNPDHQQAAPPQSLPPPPVRLSLESISDWVDAIKERGMRQNRHLYTHEKWVEHRSSRRHIRHVASSLSSRVILSLIPPVLVFTSVAAVIVAYNFAFLHGLLPHFFPLLHAPALPYQLTAPALALLLVFRTEASYSRFEEARRAWAKVIAGARDMARAVTASVRIPDDREAVLRYIMAFPLALKCHVIHGSNFEQNLGNLLDKGDLAVVMRSKHRPRCIIGFISQSLQLVQLDDCKRNLLESKVSYFEEIIAVCEELMGIPIPLSYTRLTSRFLVLWHLTLPVILWDDCNWIVIPATFISAASLYCIEEVFCHHLWRAIFMFVRFCILQVEAIGSDLYSRKCLGAVGDETKVGVLIEEPFPVLPLDELCKLACESIQESLDTEDEIRTRLQAKGKLSYKSSTGHSSNGWHMSDQHPG